MSRDSFFERWSRRKLTKDETDEADSEPAQASGEAQMPAADESAPAADSGEETLDEAEIAKLPPIEEITVDTDLTPFLRKGVPQALKNAALRKMWMLDPAIRNHRDIAVDYAWDWNVPGGVPGNAGTISGEGLARMLDSLNPKPKPTAAQPDAADERSASLPAEEPVASGEPAQAQAPMPQDPSDEDTTDPTEAESARERTTRTGRQRRHGGAAPV